MADAWDLRRLQQYLEKYKAHSLVLAFGEEAYLMNESVDLIKRKVVNEGASDFNYDQFFAGDNKVSQVRDAVETLPVMAERRLVIFKDVHKLKEADWVQLMPVLESPIESCVLVLTADKIDKRKKYYKKVNEHGIALELKKPYDNQIPMWIDYIAFQNDLQLSRDATSMVHQTVGSHLSDVNNELKKLKQYMGDKKEADVEDVLKVVSRTRVDSVFHLTDAIGRRDRAAALVCLANLLDHGQSEIGTLALIARHIRILADIKLGMTSGLSTPQLSSKVGVPQFFLKQYLHQAKSWEDAKIFKTMEVLQKTDKALKSSPVSSHIWLESFIIQTCQ